MPHLPHERGALRRELLQRTLAALPAKLGDHSRLPGGERISEAIALLDALSRADDLADFLTLPAYERID